MVDVAAALRAGRPGSGAPFASRLLLTVHDELVLEVHAHSMAWGGAGRAGRRLLARDSVNIALRAAAGRPGGARGR
jgi:hypothetical protein